jgi:plastocyanin
MMNPYSFLKLAMVAIGASMIVSACGSESSSPAAPTASTAADVTVTIQGNNGSNSYAPDPVGMRVGQTIVWRNADSVTHTATQDSGGFNTGTVTSGATSAATMMNTAGTFTYHCTIHPGMVGTINVQ